MCDKLLGVKLDWKLNFDDHIYDTCKKAHEKLNEFSQNCFIYRLVKRPIWINIFFNSQFSYCLLICEMGDAFVLFTMINSPGFQNY